MTTITNFRSDYRFEILVIRRILKYSNKFMDRMNFFVHFFYLHGVTELAQSASRQRIPSRGSRPSPPPIHPDPEHTQFTRPSHQVKSAPHTAPSAHKRRCRSPNPRGGGWTRVGASGKGRARQKAAEGRREQAARRRAAATGDSGNRKGHADGLDPKAGFRGLR